MQRNRECSPLLMLSLGSIERMHYMVMYVISELCYIRALLLKGIIEKCHFMVITMTVLWSFSYNSFVKFHGKKIWEPQNDCVISPSLLIWGDSDCAGSALIIYFSLRTFQC